MASAGNSIKETRTKERLAALAMPAGEGWLAQARAQALARVEEMGLPVARDEYWKYTRPDTLTAPTPNTAALFDTGGEAEMFEGTDRLRLVFEDGVFAPHLSDEAALEHVEISRLSQLGEAQAAEHWAKALYGTLEAEGQHPVARPLAALNTAFAPAGVVMRVTGTAPRPLHLVYLHKNETSDAMLHHLVRVEAGASVTLLESGPAAARFNTVMEVDVADGGAFHHIRTQGRDHERSAATHIFARLGEESLFKSFTLTANGVITRNECVLTLTGDNTLAHVAGACLGDGDFHHDDTVFVTHDAEHCESRQVYKKVLRNGATGVFQGKILVKEGAQKTDGYQISQSLLLDGDSQFFAKPELEIYADDVACSHGSTSGAIDEEAMFYLRSRGVPASHATDLLTLAFLAEAVEEIDNEALRAVVLERIDAWLSRRRGSGAS